MELDNKSFTQQHLILVSSRIGNIPRQFSFSRQLSRSNSALLITPIRQSISRTPFQLQLSMLHHLEHFHEDGGDRGGDDDIVGSIIPNALLYQERENGIPFDLTQLTLESHRHRQYHGMIDTNDDDDDDDDDIVDSESPEMSVHDESKQERTPYDKVITYHQQYVVYYKHEAVCVFRSSYNVHAHGTVGRSLNVTWRHGVAELQTRILHKGRTSTGGGWNAQEQRTYRVSDILDASAERYAKKQLAQM